jgi:hypothetical protein
MIIYSNILVRAVESPDYTSNKAMRTFSRLQYMSYNVIKTNYVYIVNFDEHCTLGHLWRTAI